MAVAATTPPATAPTTQATRAELAAARRVKRPTLTSDEYQAQAVELRATYSKPSDRWPKPNVDAGVKFVELGKLPAPEFPTSNPYSKEKESLGRKLFFDPRLSGSGQIACASCHDPDLAWADGRTNSFGHDRTKLRRNSPSVLFSAYATSLFWDGRSGSLEDQFRSPIAAHGEMNAKPEVVLKRLNAIADYRAEFKEVFGAEDVKMNDAAKAVATFERGLASNAGRSPFDKFMAGNADALPDPALRGLNLFRTTARCVNCHNGPVFTDNQFHEVGLSYYGRELEDLGRYEATNDPKDVGKFRTPSLRNVSRTRPYTHNGLFELEGLIRAYNAGMPTIPRSKAQQDDPMFPTKDPLLQALHLNDQDMADLKAFLESLNEPPQRVRPPKLPAGPVWSEHAS